MEKKLVSLRLEDKLHKYYKKRAIQEGMTFTDFVSKGLHYFDNFITEKENNAVDLERDNSVLYRENENIDECSTDLSIDDIQSTSDHNKEILEIKQTLQVLIEEFLNEKKRHQNIGKQIAELENRLNKIQHQKVTKQGTASKNSSTV